MDLKKEILLGIGIIALYAAAKEYGINSLGDMKRKVVPYLKWVDVLEALSNAEEPRKKARPAVAARSHSGNTGNSTSGAGRTQGRSQG
jgi:hypothetical protein